MASVGTCMTIDRPMVFLVDDDPAVLKSLPRALRRHGLDVEAFSSAREFLNSYTDRPGCLVLDLSMPGMSGLELQQELIKLEMDIPIIFITGHGGVPESVEALRAGAVDFLEKPFLPETLHKRIDEAIAQDKKARIRATHVKDIQARFGLLTEREYEVFLLLVEKDSAPSSKEIARALGISHRTVEHHRSRILEKTASRSVLELKTLAMEAGVARTENEQKTFLPDE